MAPKIQPAAPEIGEKFRSDSSTGCNIASRFRTSTVACRSVGRGPCLKRGPLSSTEHKQGKPTLIGASRATDVPHSAWKVPLNALGVEVKKRNPASHGNAFIQARIRGRGESQSHKQSHCSMSPVQPSLECPASLPLVSCQAPKHLLAFPEPMHGGPALIEVLQDFR